MHISRRSLATAALILASPIAPMMVSSAHADSNAQATAKALSALRDLEASQPRARFIARHAKAVLVFPSILKAGFVFGGETGNGVLLVHGKAAGFYNISGGSWGLQIGGQSTDLVLVAVNQNGFQDLLKNKFKIGADASASAGPVGRHGQAATDWKMNAELLTYSRSKGLFAGIDLDGTVVSQNTEDTSTFYGQDHTFESILKGNVEVPSSAVPFVKDVAHYFVEAKNHE